MPSQKRLLANQHLFVCRSSVLVTFPFSENTLTDLGFVSKYFGLTKQETSWIKEIDYKWVNLQNDLYLGTQNPSKAENGIK